MLAAIACSVAMLLGPAFENALPAALSAGTVADGRVWKYLGSGVVTGLPFLSSSRLAGLLAEHDVGELLADDLRAHKLAAHVDLLAVGVPGECDLADAGDHQGVEDSAQEGQNDDPDRGADDVLPHG